MGGRWLFMLALLPVVAGGCERREEGLAPVGGSEATLSQKERFVRRPHLDLTGSAPGEDAVTRALERLDAEGNTAAARRALADELLAGREFAEAYVAELENRLFVGRSVADAYQQLCGIFRNDPACQSCGPPQDSDLCTSCTCAPITRLVDERTQVLASVDDLAAGTATGIIERRWGGALAYRAFLGAPETVATAVFDDFLLRAPEPDELRNAAAMITGSLLGPDQPAGLLFHRHGGSVEDFIDIVFESEVYREAVVNAVFLRYLGRAAGTAELVHFAGLARPSSDAEAPDARTVIREVVASREYFDQ